MFLISIVRTMTENIYRIPPLLPTPLPYLLACEGACPRRNALRMQNGFDGGKRPAGHSLIPSAAAAEHDRQRLCMCCTEYVHTCWTKHASTREAQGRFRGSQPSRPRTCTGAFANMKDESISRLRRPRRGRPCCPFTSPCPVSPASLRNGRFGRVPTAVRSEIRPWWHTMAPTSTESQLTRTIPGGI